MNKRSLRIILAMMEPPLPFGNAAARWYYVLLKGLVERGHKVTALATCSKSAQIAQAEELFPQPQFDLRCYPHPVRRGLRAKWESFIRPQSYMFNNGFLSDLKAEKGRGFDVIHLEPLWLGWVALDCREHALINVQYLSRIDLENASCSTRYQWLLRARTFHAETSLLRKYKYFRSLTPRLTLSVKESNPDARVFTLPLGIDNTKYTYIPNEARLHEPVVSLIGSMNWYPGFSAAKRLITRLWPDIKARVPNAKLQVAGWDARKALKEYLDLSDVTIEENVSDTRPYFERTGVFVYAPARGSGMKVKVLEAFAYGVPVVTTSEGVEGIPATDGIHAGVCEDDEGLIERTVRLLSDPAAQDKQRYAARQLLEQYCSPQRTLDGIELIYADMLSGHQ